MARFKQYITEGMLSEKGSAGLHADLIFQKLLDVLDHAHIDFDDDRIEFHVGRLSKNSNIDLRLVIRPSEDESVKLGRKKEGGDMYIVVDTKESLPVRTEIDSFLAKNRERAQAVKGAISEYITDHHGNNPPPSTKTGYEDEAEANSSANFEQRYEQAVKQLHEKMKEYKGVVAELDEIEQTEDFGKRATVAAAKKTIAAEYFGEDVESFKKIARGLMSKDEFGENTGFANNLSKENKERLDNRLESFYDQHVKPLLK